VGWHTSCDIFSRAAGPPTTEKSEDAMKIYLLMLLIGAIAAASHRKEQRQPVPVRQTT
jgi:hypothetical protein